MEFETKYISPDIKLSLFTGKSFRTEVMFDHHMLVWFISGETKIIHAAGSYVFKENDIFLIPRNQLVTVINYAASQSVVMYLTKDTLKAFYAKHEATGKPQPLQTIRLFTQHPLLKSCMASLIPYFDLGDDLPADIASIKIEEAISILRSVDKEIDGLLANFEEPGKIDLADFMEKNYMFNMPLERFCYLTGRSVTTFRRDFKKVYQTTPQNWLTKKRLELAHYQIVEKKRKPTEVYFEAGFENLSHFSFAFKKHFGYSPIVLLNH